MGAAVVAQLAFPVPPREKNAKVLLARSDLVWLRTVHEKLVPAIHIKLGARTSTADRPSLRRDSTFTVLYSHGNADDLGGGLGYLDVMANMLGVDVFAYDYLGYGLSEGEPSEEGCYEALDAAYEYLSERVEPCRIIVYGDSIGTGPTVDLCHRTTGPGGMILGSPFRSGAHAAFGQVAADVGYRFDIFRSYEKISSVDCPVLIIHGRRDKVVPFEDGLAMYEACRCPVEPLWLDECGHHDMPFRRCLERINRFLDELWPGRVAPRPSAFQPRVVRRILRRIEGGDPNLSVVVQRVASPSRRDLAPYSTSRSPGPTADRGATKHVASLSPSRNGTSFVDIRQHSLGPAALHVPTTSLNAAGTQAAQAPERLSSLMMVNVREAPSPEVLTASNSESLTLRLSASSTRVNSNMQGTGSAKGPLLTKVLTTSPTSSKSGSLKVPHGGAPKVVANAGVIKSSNGGSVKDQSKAPQSTMARSFTASTRAFPNKVLSGGSRSAATLPKFGPPPRNLAASPPRVSAASPPRRGGGSSPPRVTVGSPTRHIRITGGSHSMSPPPSMIRVRSGVLASNASVAVGSHCQSSVAVSARAALAARSPTRSLRP